MEPSPLVRTLCASSTRDTRAAHATVTSRHRSETDPPGSRSAAESGLVCVLGDAASRSRARAATAGARHLLPSPAAAAAAVGVFWAFAATPPRWTGTGNVSGWEQLEKPPDWVVAGLPCSVGATKVCGAACWAGSGRGGEVGTPHGTRPDASTSDFAGALDCFRLCPLASCVIHMEPFMGDSQIFCYGQLVFCVYFQTGPFPFPAVFRPGLGLAAKRPGLVLSLWGHSQVQRGRDVTAASPRTPHPYSRRGQAVAVTLGRGTRSSHGNLIFSQCR